MFDGERKPICLSAQIEVGVTPGMDLAGSAQRLTRAQMSGTFAGVVDEQDGGCMAALQATQESEQRSDVRGDILVDAVDSDEGIENEEFWPQAGNGLLQPFLVLRQIEPDFRGGNDVDVEGLERDLGGRGNSCDATAHLVESILGGKEQDGSGLPRWETTQAGRARGNGDGQVEGEEALAALGLPPDDADGLVAPEPLDQPALGLGLNCEIEGSLYREAVHRLLGVVRAVPAG